MPSDKQIRASKANGALSRGPVTEQGKRNCARNGTRHGLLSQTVVLEAEVDGRFLELFEDYLDEYQPRTASQVSFVENMAVARWRQFRIWGMQKSAMDRDMALQDPAVGPAPIRALFALRNSAENLGSPDVLLRYEIAFERQFSHALTRLLELQALPITRKVAPYHPESPAGQTWKEEPREEPREESRKKEEEEKTLLPNEPSKGLKTND
jgi:hypothetical protein